MLQVEQLETGYGKKQVLFGPQRLRSVEARAMAFDGTTITPIVQCAAHSGLAATYRRKCGPLGGNPSPPSGPDSARRN
jgi:hypothetical protein